jgi:hypothetical protein
MILLLVYAYDDIDVFRKAERKIENKMNDGARMEVTPDRYTVGKFPVLVRCTVPLR